MYRHWDVIPHCVVMVGSIDLVSSIDTLSLVLVVSVCMAGAVDVRLYVRLNRLVWSTQAGDAVKSERWGAAQNSTFELGADEVRCYGWPRIARACYGRVQPGSSSSLGKHRRVARRLSCWLW